MVSSPQPGHERARLVALPSPTLAQADDATLARATSAGDPRATSVVWDRFSPLVRRMLRRTLGPHVEVEPLVQRVFVRTVDELTAVPETVQLRPLIVGVTVRVLHQHLKRKRIRRLFRLRGARASALHTAADATTRAALGAVYDILDGLDVNARIAFSLRYFEGMAVAELASATDSSLAAARRRLARASAHVRGAVQQAPSLSAYATAASLGEAP